MTYSSEHKNQSRVKIIPNIDDDDSDESVRSAVTGDDNNG